MVAIGDGGGKASAGLRPIYSRERVSRGFLGKTPPDRAWIEEVNGQPAIVATLHGKLYGVLILDVRAGQVQTLYLMVNSDKLQAIQHQIETVGCGRTEFGAPDGLAGEV